MEQFLYSGRSYFAGDSMYIQKFHYDVLFFIPVSYSITTVRDTVAGSSQNILIFFC